MKILILNSGSSTIKFKLFEKNEKGFCELKKGLLENIKNHEDGLKIMNAELIKSGHIKNINELKHVGHRVVHGGETGCSFQKINAKIIQTIKKLASLAPLHNPANLKGILACQKMFPRAIQWAFFDTAFHQTLPEKAYRYAVPENWYTKYGIRKYGFHGTSHEFVAKKAIQYLRGKKLPYKKLISCHIGNGVSITAIHNGKSIDTSMGFTPLEGVPMGTRSGSIDPAVPLIMQRLLQSTSQNIENILNTKSGLFALSELESDMRVIYKISQGKKFFSKKKNFKKISSKNEIIKKAKKTIE
ncbi:acetate/propionate family kinase, partial [Candidatus Peregrinibacteria bacterium]|nr:acetate/propionate family kinase [Candidatus Peregrinibacteria bacterium]